MKSFKKSLAIIPVRYNSTRLPGKPLRIINGKTILYRVFKNVNGIFDKTIIATPDEKILKYAKNFAEVYMTSKENVNGSEACAEVAKNFDSNIVVNVQGDKPFISKDALRKIVEWDLSTEMATLVYPIVEDSLYNSNRVKAVINGDLAIDYTREKIDTKWQSGGVYVYGKDFLMKYKKMERTKREIKEKLEQLRALENGCRIRAFKVYEELKSIDSIEDIKKYI